MSYALCHRILEGLWAAGVRDIIVSPGSRSTPLLLAALESEFSLTSIIDERSAAFFALGRARCERRPVALLCTSGSAGAHYLPALLEARYSERCLVALTADRPSELHDSGANQTIDQRQLFAAACPPALEISGTEESERAHLAARRRIHSAVALASGPIHVNVAFRKPLEPNALTSRPPAVPLPTLVPPRTRLSEEFADEVAALCATSERGLVVCGPLSCEETAAAASKLAALAGVPLLAEATSGARFTGASHPTRILSFGHILASEAKERLEPAWILQFGADPVSGPLLRFLEGSRAKRVRFGSAHYRDAEGHTQAALGDARDAAERIAAKVTPREGLAYQAMWKALEADALSSMKTALSSEGPGLGEAAAVQAVLASLPDATQLTLGNSLPIRIADAVPMTTLPRLRVLHQRGTSGIEGLVAGAIGSARGGPSVLLLGDVSFAHDLSSLALQQHAEAPLVIVVIDNGGGKIFSHLPVANLELPEQRWSFWETPTSTDFLRAAESFGASGRECATSEELRESLPWALSKDGVTVLRVRVEPDSAKRVLERCQDALAKALDS